MRKQKRRSSCACLLVEGELCDFVHQCATGSPRIVGRSFTHFDLNIAKAFGNVFSMQSESDRYSRE